MDKDRIRGAMDDEAGRIKCQAGEWTGNPNTEAEGAAQQIKGKTEKAVGQLKDAARDWDEKRAEERRREHRDSRP